MSTASTMSSPVQGSRALGAIASAAAPASGQKSLEAVVGAPAPRRSFGSPGMACPSGGRGLHSGPDIVAHIPGGRYLEAGAGQGEWALGEDSTTHMWTLGGPPS